MARRGSRWRLGGFLVLAWIAAGCGGADADVVPPDAHVAQGPDHPPVEGGSTDTPWLDSIVVLGHSGTTGFGSDPTRPGVDVPQNSWATGSNVQVRSVYQRLVFDRPQLRGHATTLGVDGSTVDGLIPQVERMRDITPVPDLVMIQTIDNDIRCDGTDVANQLRFARTLDAVLTRIADVAPRAQVFVVDQWASVRTYAELVRDRADLVSAMAGDGPCDTFTTRGAIRPEGVASLQGIVDGYFDRAVRVCARHPRCWTDGGALQRMPLRPGDVTADGNHLSVQGQAVMARYVWEAMPAAITERE